MNDYARLVMSAWATWKPSSVYFTGLPLSTRFEFRRDEHRQLRACFVEYNTGGYVRMVASYVVDEDRPIPIATFYERREP